MRPRDYFPLGVAVDLAFCNREEETRLLIENIKNGKHTLLMATRRYGKSSLALHTLRLSGLPYVEIDFYMARSEKVIEGYILHGVIEAIGKALGPAEKLIASVKKYVKNLKPKLDLSLPALQLELTTDVSSDPATNIKEALLLLEHLLAEKGKQVVLLMDEFQNVGAIAKGFGIEAAIRHAAQKTKYLTLIFSGSNRKLLKAMFEDENRPLYKLCWKIMLKRIQAQHYQKHIQKVSKLVWKKTLPDEVLETIITLTERHPYYLNKLCDRLLAYYEKSPPSVTEVLKSWGAILTEDQSDAIKEISQLSIGQKKVLLQIAKGGTHVSSKEQMFAMQMTSGSIFTAITGLEEKDILEKEGQYKIINPIVKHYVLKNDM